MNETARQSTDTDPFKQLVAPTKYDTQSSLGPLMSLDSPIRLNQDSACKFENTSRDMLILEEPGKNSYLNRSIDFRNDSKKGSF